MKKRRIVNIKTNCFELTFRYNGKLLSTILMSTFVMLVLLVVTKSWDMQVMLLLFLGVLLVLSIALIFNGFKVEVKDEDLEKSTNKEETSNMISSTGEHTKKKKEVKETKSVIKNKVAIPNPKPVNNNSVTNSVENNATTEEKKAIPVEELSETNWDEIFSLDDDFFG